MKIKVTYIDAGIIKASILNLDNGWYNLMNSLNEVGIQNYHLILKIETILEADKFDTQDFTQSYE